MKFQLPKLAREWNYMMETYIYIFIYIYIYGNMVFYWDLMGHLMVYNGNVYNYIYMETYDLLTDNCYFGP